MVVDADATTDATINTIDIAAGGADTITISNDTIDTEATSDDHVVIKGFTVGEDKFAIKSNADITSTNSITTINTGSDSTITGNPGGNGIIEITGGGPVGATTGADTSDGGDVELAIAAAIGLLTNAAGDNYAVILYDGASNAYLYTANFSGADGTNVVTSNMTVELVAVLEGVAFGALTATDFI